MKNKNFVRWITILKAYRTRIAIAAVCIFLAALTNVLFPWLLQHILDATVIKKNISLLLILAFFTFILYMVRSVVNYGRIYQIEFLARVITSDLRKRFFNHLQKLPIIYYENRHTGQLMAKVTSDIKLIEETIIRDFNRFFIQFLSLIGAVAFLVYLHRSLGLIIIFAYAFIVGLLKLLKFKAQKITNDIQDKNEKLNIVLEENISARQLVKAYGKEKFEIRRFNRIDQELLASSLYEIKFNVLFDIVSNFVGGLCLIYILIFGGIEVINGRLSIGKLIAFILYMQIVQGYASSVFNGYFAFQKISVASKRIFEILDEKPETEAIDNLTVLPAIKGRIEFKDISFGYIKDIQVVKNISFSIEPGQVVALVGQVGAGKSTIIKLLLRFYDADKGTITVDGHDIKNISHSSLRNHISVVLQEDILFDATISENIAYGDSQVSFDRIVEAAKLTNIHQFVNTLPDGYNTQVGEKGLKLSSGQRQCIGIARAIYRNVPILILDEGFSCLDLNSEMLIQGALQKATKDRAVLVVAHKLSTIINATKIVVLNEGKIVGVGTHCELIGNNETYNKLYKTQLENIRER